MENGTGGAVGDRLNDGAAAVGAAAPEAQGGAAAPASGQTGGSGDAAAQAAAQGDNGAAAERGGFTQADIDRAVDAAKKQWTAEQDEAARLSKLTKDERTREELRLGREKLDKERAAFEREKLETETARQLAERRLPAGMAARLCGSDAEETKANIDAFEADWNKALKAAVSERLSSGAPKAPGADARGGGSMKDIIEENIKRGF